jgi:hypothetical protein
MGTPPEEAGRDEDIRRAQRVLNAQEGVVLTNRDASASLADLVAQIRTQNPELARRTPSGSSGPTAATSDVEDPDIFISYAAERRGAVLPIKDALVRHGYTVFFDFESLRGGYGFADVIDARLKKSRAVVACWSEESFTSRWCKNEWRVGSHRRTLVPVALHPVTLEQIPTEFNDIQYIDFANFSGAPGDRCFQDLLRAIEPLLSRHAR